MISPLFSLISRDFVNKSHAGRLPWLFIKNHSLMKIRSQYRLSIEDEGTLETIATYTASPLRWLLRGILVFSGIMALGALVAFLTPLRQLLPGYMKESERTATQIQLLRLDSLRQAYETNALFISNLREVLDPKLKNPDTLVLSELTLPILSDSLLIPSVEETRFVALIKEKEKYNVSVLAPLAAESMMFNPLNDESIVTATSRTSPKAEIIMARNAPVAAIADGTVISVSQSLREGGAIVLIQHPKGFLSRCSRLGQVLVEAGDIVTGGQVIALTNRGNARNGETVNLEIWHNGNPLIPYDYIGDKTQSYPHSNIMDDESGGGQL